MAADPFIGEITMFGGNFAPRGWAFCDGQLLAISTNSALFSLLGTTYGGDGRTTFGLPDLRGRMPLHQGSGPGLTRRNLGQRNGTENHTLSIPELPSHGHSIGVSSTVGNAKTPGGNLLAQSNDGENNFTTVDADGEMTTQNSGTGQGHNNMPPFLAVNFIIALEGIYPSRA
jgi:microcystin-dependent protein